MAVGDLIRERRLRARLKQGELAERAGITQTTLSAIETGKHAPSYSSLQKLSRALGVPATELMEPVWEGAPEVGTIVYAADAKDLDAEAFLTAMRVSHGRIPGGPNNDEIGIGIEIIDRGEGQERVEFIVKRRPFEGWVRRRG